MAAFNDRYGWHLLRDLETGHGFVRYTSNAASGGHVSDIALSAFLAADRGGLEHRALWQLIGTLTNDVPTPSSAVA